MRHTIMHGPNNDALEAQAKAIMDEVEAVMMQLYF